MTPGIEAPIDPPSWDEAEDIRCARCEEIVPANTTQALDDGIVCWKCLDRRAKPADWNPENR